MEKGREGERKEEREGGKTRRESKIWRNRRWY